MLYLAGNPQEAPVHGHGEGADGVAVVVVLDLQLGVAATAAVAHIPAHHESRIKTEAKAKVVASVWGQNLFNSLPR